MKINRTKREFLSFGVFICVSTVLQNLHVRIAEPPAARRQFLCLLFVVPKMTREFVIWVFPAILGVRRKHDPCCSAFMIYETRVKEIR